MNPNFRWKATLGGLGKVQMAITVWIPSFESSYKVTSVNIVSGIVLIGMN